MKIEQRIGCRLLGAASVLLSSSVVSHALQCKHFLYSTNVPHSFHVPLVFALQSPFRCKCGMQYRPRVSRKNNSGRERSSLKLPLVRRKRTKKKCRITWKTIFMRHSHTSLRWVWRDARDWSRRMLEKKGNNMLLVAIDIFSRIDANFRTFWKFAKITSTGASPFFHNFRFIHLRTGWTWTSRSCLMVGSKNVWVNREKGSAQVWIWPEDSI